MDNGARSSRSFFHSRSRAEERASGRLANPWIRRRDLRKPRSARLLDGSKRAIHRVADRSRSRSSRANWRFRPIAGSPTRGRPPGTRRAAARALQTVTLVSFLFGVLHQPNTAPVLGLPLAIASYSAAAYLRSTRAVVGAASTGRRSRSRGWRRPTARSAAADVPRSNQRSDPSNPATRRTPSPGTRIERLFDGVAGRSAVRILRGAPRRPTGEMTHPP
jgi:hypothetical protein